MRVFTRQKRLFLMTAAALLAAGAPCASYAQDGEAGQVQPAQAAVGRADKIAGYAYGAKDPALSRAVATRLVTALVNSGRYRAAEEYREFFEYVAAGHAKSPAPIGVEQFKLMGRQFGADYVCVAEIATVFGEERIFAHIVDVEAAKIIAIGAGDTPLNKPADLTAASNQVVEEMLNAAPPPPPSQASVTAPAQTPDTAQAQPSNQQQEPLAGETGGKAGKTRTAKKTKSKIKNGLSLGQGYDPDIKIVHLGFAQICPVTKNLISFTWEADLFLAWDNRHKDGDYYYYDDYKYYGVTVPLLCRFDLNSVFIETGVQLDAVLNDYSEEVIFNAGLAAGAGISFSDMFQLYYRFGYGTEYYSQAIGLRVLF